jgi:hypothetical protein
VQISADLDKSVTIVKAPSDLVFFKDLDTQVAFNREGMIDHRPAKPLSVPGRIEKQSAYLVANHRYEPDRFTVIFEHPRFRIRKVLCPQVGCLAGHESVTKEWVGEGAGGLPDGNEPLGIAWLEFPDYRVGVCAGHHFIASA